MPNRPSTSAVELLKVPDDGDRQALLAVSWAIRREVFIEEQKVPFDEEIDGLDAIAEHLLLMADGVGVGTGRLLRPVQVGGAYHIGRVAIRAPWRGLGLGQRLMRGLEGLALVDLAGRAGPGLDQVEVELSAQLQALGFYQRLGYTNYGRVYLDAGIPHQDAIRRVRRPEVMGLAF